LQDLFENHPLGPKCVGANKFDFIGIFYIVWVLTSGVCCRADSGVLGCNVE